MAPSQRSIGHYENFPVASMLLPRSLRKPAAVIYRFARSADDFADEGDIPASERLQKLDAYRAGLRCIEAGRQPASPLFSDLAATISVHQLPYRPFYDLLDAFSQDVVKSRYASFEELMQYCRRSADPVGRLMLHLYGAAQTQNLAQSDAICSALQLINFWQDVEIDFRKDRIYLPQDELAHYGVTESQIGRQEADQCWHNLMAFQVERARALLLSGAPLAMRLRGRIGLELRMIVQGGLRITDKLQAVQYDVFRRRPVLKQLDWPLMLARALGMS